MRNEDGDGSKGIRIKIEGYLGMRWGVVDFIYRKQRKGLGELICCKIDHIPLLLKLF